MSCAALVSETAHPGSAEATAARVTAAIATRARVMAQSNVRLQTRAACGASFCKPLLGGIDPKCISSDNAVSSQKDRVRNGKAEGFGRLKIYRDFEDLWLLHG